MTTYSSFVPVYFSKPTSQCSFEKHHATSSVFFSEFQGAKYSSIRQDNIITHLHPGTQTLTAFSVIQIRKLHTYNRSLVYGCFDQIIQVLHFQCRLYVF